MSQPNVNIADNTTIENSVILEGISIPENQQIINKIITPSDIFELKKKSKVIDD